MFTISQAENLGWSFVVEGDNGTASKDGVEMLQVYSGVPLFAMLVEVADREGQGSLDRTAAVILAATGEVYAEPAEPAPVVTEQDALVAKLASGEASDIEVQQTLARLLGG